MSSRAHVRAKAIAVLLTASALAPNALLNTPAAAVTLAPEPGPAPSPPTPMPGPILLNIAREPAAAAERDAGPSREELVAIALREAHEHLGKPYVWGGTGPDGFDCSGLMLVAWQEAGIQLPRVSTAQFDALPRVPLEQMQPGDLVFSGNGSVSHVGMYVGDGQMIASPRSGGVVRVEPLHTNLIGAGRPIDWAAGP